MHRPQAACFKLCFEVRSTTDSIRAMRDRRDGVNQAAPLI
jgi:hypothetical protein